MVVNNLVHSLIETGFSEYEARAYVALLRKNPLTAYEIAREAGIPTAKVYGVVTRLSDKGLFSVTGEGKRKSYMPLDPDEFLSGLRGRIQNTLTQIEGGFTNLARKPEVARVHNIKGYDYLLEKAQRLISGSQRTLLISVWKNEMTRLHPEIRKAAGRQVKAATVHFGQPGLRAGTIFSHPVNGGETVSRNLVVVADSREALTGTVHADGSAEGVTSANSGFVSLAESYITHDIYMMKLTKRFDREFRMTFGYDYEKLRDVYSDDAHN